MTRRSKLTPTEQSKRFVEAAREIGCDEDGGAFKERLKKLTSAPPPASVENRKAKNRKD
jgi:hypothetical protein